MGYLFKVTAAGEKTLVELPGKEAKALLAGEHNEAKKGVRYEPCSLSRAHQWVRDGGDHQTSLWLDYAGRLRRAG
jgi:hypothetical protein